MKTNIKNIVLLCASSLFAAVSCFPDRVEDGNGLLPAAGIDGTFTVIETSPNHYTFKANSTNYILSKWQIDNEGAYIGKMTEDVFLPDAGTYTVLHQAIGQGGVVAASSTQTITVAASDPNAGNLIKGGKFLNSDDWSKWTVNNTGLGAQWTFTTGRATLTATGSAGQGIYQAIQVVAGKKYKIDLLASSTSGCTDTWFEVYCGYNVPVPGSDYNGNGTIYRSINTWDGSGKVPFSGKISIIGQVNPSKNTGEFTATQTGTVYLGIRGGGADMKDGIAITNVEFRGVN